MGPDRRLLQQHLHSLQTMRNRLRDRLRLPTFTIEPHNAAIPRTSLLVQHATSTTKYGGVWFGKLKTLSGLAVLATRMNLDNPVLSYVVATVLAIGLMLSPTEVSKMDMIQRHIRWALTDGLGDIVEEAVKEITGTMQKNRKFRALDNFFLS